jgi:hypothetical protein
MKILIAKHYWKNGKIATWEYHQKLDKKIFEYLKENYHNFVKERKSKIEKNGYFIYLCYENAKDDHARDITNITFLISKSKPKETSNLCHKIYKNLELKVKAEKDNRNLILIVLGLIILLTIGVLSINSVKTKASNTQQVIQPKVENYTHFIDSWNEQVLNITDNKSYLLKRDNNIKLITQLNNFEKVFYEDFNKSKVNEYKGSEIDSYKEYIEKNHIEKKILFKEKMSKDEIKKTLKKVTRENSMSDIVYKILNMNNIEVFLKEERKYL